MSFYGLTSIDWTVPETLDKALTYLRPYQSYAYAFDAATVCIATWLLLRWLRTSRQRIHTTQLRGPPSESFLYGVGKRILGAADSGAMYEAWAREYGPAYEVPSALGTKRIVLCDPKAITHFYSKETWTYILTPFSRENIATFIGKGIIWAHGEDHKRQRKSLTPAFSVAALRELTPIFYDSTYKAKGAWDALIGSGGGDSAVIEIQNWMNHISLDSIGCAGFSHNFGALEGKRASMTEVFDIFGDSPESTALNEGLVVLGEVFPSLARVPTARTRLRIQLNKAMEEISDALLARTRKEREMGIVEGKGEKSIIGLLIKGADTDSEFHLTKDEVMAQMKVLLIAGYETTSITLSWTLLELSRNPNVQTKLRDELLKHDVDPTYDQLANGLPYLDAVVHEILRIHPPIVEFTRLAVEDDVIPLSEPVLTKSGELVDSLTIAKGTLDAKIFRPSRWLEDMHGQDGIPAKAKEIKGHRHLLTFVDGPRMCLGKNFALTEMKAVLTVLVRNFVFEMRDGVDTKVEIGRGVLPRPNVVGEVGCKLPLRVQPYVG